MQRFMGVRIVRWYFKLAFVAGAWVVGYVIQSLLELVRVPLIALEIVGSAITLVSIIVGARIFRGRDEPLTIPRPWWKMTARRPLSWVLGILALLGVVGIVVPQLVGRLSTPAPLANSVISALSGPRRSPSSTSTRLSVSAVPLCDLPLSLNPGRTR